MVDYKAIGRRIALNRKRASMTQAAMAEKLEVSESFVSQIERGNAKVSLPRLYQIAELLNLDVAVLVSDVEKQGNTVIRSEIEQIIQDWSLEQRSMLIELILCADNKMKSN